MGQDFRYRLAKNVAKYRIARKMKREELSLALGFDNSYISKLERCKVNITLDRITAIAKFFGIDIVEIFR